MRDTDHGAGQGAGDDFRGPAELPAEERGPPLGRALGWIWLVLLGGAVLSGVGLWQVFAGDAPGLSLGQIASRRDERTALHVLLATGWSASIVAVAAYVLVTRRADWRKLLLVAGLVLCGLFLLGSGRMARDHLVAERIATQPPPPPPPDGGIGSSLYLPDPEPDRVERHPTAFWVHVLVGPMALIALSLPLALAIRRYPR